VSSATAISNVGGVLPGVSHLIWSPFNERHSLSPTLLKIAVAEDSCSVFSHNTKQRWRRSMRLSHSVLDACNASRPLEEGQLNGNKTKRKHASHTSPGRFARTARHCNFGVRCQSLAERHGIYGYTV